MVEENEDRKDITLNTTGLVGINGYFDVWFSETLYGIDDMDIMNLTLLNFHKDMFLNITYYTNVEEGENKNYPTLKSWSFTKFTPYLMGI